MRKYILSALVGCVSAFVVLLLMAGTADGLTRLSLHSFNDGMWKPVNIDRATRAFEAIDYPHHEVHDGDSFWYSDVVTLNSTSQDYLITTPNSTQWDHFTYDFDAQGLTDLEIYEATARAGTDLQVVYNRDRNSATTSVLTVHKNTGAGADGTRILYRSAGSRLSTFSTTGEERVLKSNTKYIFRITTHGNYTVSVVFNWYQHTNKV
jgi:hypothetical protein